MVYYQAYLSLIVLGSLLFVFDQCNAFYLQPQLVSHKSNSFLQRVFPQALNNTTIKFSFQQQLTGIFPNQTNAAQNWQSLKIGSADWWKKATEGRRGLLLILIPIVTTQFRILQSAFPFCIDRFLQYSHPINLLLLTTISSTTGIRIMKSVLIAGTLLGVIKMLQDTYLYGPNLLPILPQPDSYALITGASSGLGKELAKKFFSEGYNLILVSSNMTKLEAAKEDILALPSSPIRQKEISDAVKVSEPPSLIQLNSNIGKEEIPSDPREASYEESDLPNNLSKDIQLIQCNLENPFASFSIMKELKKRDVDSKIDVLVCNAGKCIYGPVEKSSFLSIRKLIDVNIGSTLGLVRFIIPRMLERKRKFKGAGGRVVIVSSITSGSSAANIATYAASKAFLTSFSHSLRKELFPKGILVTLALPGPITDSNFLYATEGLKHFPTKSKIPGINFSSKFNAEKIFDGMRLGHETIVPGLPNQFFYHILCKILPRSTLADLVEMGWSAPPKLKTKHIKHHKNDVKHHQSHHSEHNLHRHNTHHNPPPKNFKEKMIEFWNQPVIDYRAMNQWFKNQWKQLKKPRHAFDQHDHQKQEAKPPHYYDEKENEELDQDSWTGDQGEEVEEEKKCEEFFDKALSEANEESPRYSRRKHHIPREEENEDYNDDSRNKEGERKERQTYSEEKGEGQQQWDDNEKQENDLFAQDRWDTVEEN